MCVQLFVGKRLGSDLHLLAIWAVKLVAPGGRFWLRRYVLCVHLLPRSNDEIAVATRTVVTVRCLSRYERTVEQDIRFIKI